MKALKYSAKIHYPSEQCRNQNSSASDITRIVIDGEVANFRDKLYTNLCRHYQCCKMEKNQLCLTVTGSVLAQSLKVEAFLWLTINVKDHLLTLMLIKAALCVDLQVDTDKDRLVSLNEFMAATKKEEFVEKDEWEVRARFYRKKMLSFS